MKKRGRIAKTDTKKKVVYLRLDKELKLLQLLVEEANQLQVSLNTLVTQKLKKYYDISSKETTY